MDTPNPYAIAAVIALAVMSWAVVSTVLALAFGRAIKIANRRRPCPRYRRGAWR